MIHRLNIQGMAIIEELSIDFSSGFNVITGETGAGKSILIRALSFLLGQKVGPDMIRKGFESSTVTGEFFLGVKHDVFECLKKAGIPFEVTEGLGTIVIRRQVNTKGRASAWINDCPVTQVTLKEVGLNLVDIFGQHDNQKLMKAEFHLSYLDQFISDPKPLKEYKQKYRSCTEALREVESILVDFHSGRRDLDYRLFRLKELEDFEPALEDYQEARDLTDNSRAALELNEGLASVLQILETGQDSVNGRLWESVKKLSRLADKVSNASLREMKNKAEGLASELDSLGFELSRLAGVSDLDEKSIEEAHQRLFGYQELFRKHSVNDVEGLLREYEKLNLECLSQEALGEKLEDELKKILETAQELEGLAREISTLRLKAAHKVKKWLKRNLRIWRCLDLCLISCGKIQILSEGPWMSRVLKRKRSLNSVRRLLLYLNP